MTEVVRPEGGAASAGTVTVDLPDLARDVIARVAPEQLDYLRLVTEAWEVGRARRSWKWTGGAVGVGNELDVVTDVVFPLLTSTIAQVWGAATFANLQRRRWSRRKAAPATITLDLRHLALAHAACVHHGTTLGLSTAEATLLADAFEATLRRQADGPA
ncbi:hypothetical protein [Actinokineospora globicatena]|uniref:Uncharacterized protein n=1 Tax=Actinokineospora globicatena TaxID=103729 RepID=A0A9W6QIW5_9PSEU|nr:hypothetical protein [Actinokineospora globicatena]GLW90510.1 hypothetical protein Aglo03_13260 [Actinokineospora globicatena]